MNAGETLTILKDVQGPCSAPWREQREIQFTNDEKHLLFHSRPKDKGGGGDYALNVWDIGSNKLKARLRCWPSLETARFAASSDGSFIINGDGDYRITRFDLKEARETTLFACEPELKSHWLELRLFNNQRVAAWSSERREICLYDMKSRNRSTLSMLSEVRGTFRFTDNGRYAIHLHDNRLDVIDIKYGKVARSMPWDWANIAETTISDNGDYILVRKKTDVKQAETFQVFKRGRAP
jgi:hypothetical protein